MNPWFEALGDRFVRAGAARKAVIEAPQLESAYAEEILELARVTAHSQERRFAPLASFMAGIAVERLRAAGRPAAPEDVAAYLREVRSGLETEPPA
jgi:uncharacterized protein DUF6457